MSINPIEKKLKFIIKSKMTINPIEKKLKFIIKKKMTAQLNKI